MQALLYTLAPVLAVVLGAIVASRTKLKPGLVAGLQHLAAGVVFAAAATESCRRSSMRHRPARR